MSVSTPLFLILRDDWIAHPIASVVCTRDPYEGMGNLMVEMINAIFVVSILKAIRVKEVRSRTMLFYYVLCYICGMDFLWFKLLKMTIRFCSSNSLIEKMAKARGSNEQASSTRTEMLKLRKNRHLRHDFKYHKTSHIKLKGNLAVTSDNFHENLVEESSLSKNEKCWPWFLERMQYKIGL